MQNRLLKDRLKVYDCGVSPYKDVLNLQHSMCRHRWQGKIPNTILVLEHAPVITLGARESENKLTESVEDIKEQGIDLVKIGRGGGATAHNPGQAVLYPILHLKEMGLGVNEYIRQLEYIGMELLSRYGLKVERRKKYPGLWLGSRKIASIGVQLKHWVTFHGIAININNDLSIFDNIIPCGIEDIKMTNLEKEISSKVDIIDVKENIKAICRDLWEQPGQ